MLLQQKVKRLESENSMLRQRLSDIAQIKGQVSSYFSAVIGSHAFAMGEVPYTGGKLLERFTGIINYLV
jgi:hypothetical protein